MDQIASGRYGSEYIRDLIRRDLDQNPQSCALKRPIHDDMEIGISTKTVKDIWAETEQCYRTM